MKILRLRNRFFALMTLAIIAAILVISVPWFWRLFYPFPYRESILRHAGEYELDPNLVVAVIRVESKFRSNAESSRGAKGLMQLMPETAQWAAEQMGVSYDVDKLFDPDYNIALGCWYLSNLLQEFDHNLPVALAAYNGGRGNVKQWLKDRIWDGEADSLEQIPFGETKQFVARVLHDYKIYAHLYAN